MPELTQSEYDELREAIKYHIGEFLDFLYNDKEVLYALTLRETDFPQITDFFEDREHTMHIRHIDLSGEPATYYVISLEPAPPDMSPKALGERGQAQTAEILGYPSCCGQIFEETNKSDTSDRIHQIDTFQTHPFQMNSFHHSAILSHFPCGFDCQRSKEIAMRRYKRIKKFDLDLAQQLENKLSGLLIHHPKYGGFMTNDSEKTGRDVSYSGFTEVLEPDSSKLKRALENNGSVQITTEGELQFNNAIFTDDAFNLAYFD